MARSLTELSVLQREYKVPLIVAGDIFNHFKEPPQLINFAIEHMPDRTHTIPGQHDLELHNYANIEKSAYWTLVKAGATIDMGFGNGYPISDNLTVHPFPWGFDVEPWQGGQAWPGTVRLAVIHSYIWIKGHSYQGAKHSAKLGKWKDRLEGYDAAVFGDNHCGFLVGNIFNCGTLIRNKSDEVNYKPQVGILYSDGTIKRKRLDVSQDKLGPADGVIGKMAAGELDLSDAIKELKKLGATGLDFLDSLRRFVESDDVSERAKIVVLKMIEAVHGKSK